MAGPAIRGGANPEVAMVPDGPTNKALKYKIMCHLKSILHIIYKAYLEGAGKSGPGSNAGAARIGAAKAGATYPGATAAVTTPPALGAAATAPPNQNNRKNTIYTTNIYM